MAVRHKYEGASLTAITTLAPARVAELAERSARQAESVKATVCLEEAKPERLVYSIRNRIVGGTVEFLTFHVTLTDSAEGRRIVKTKILSFKVSTDWLSSKMLGWSTYKRFMEHLQTGIGASDPASITTLIEISERA